MDKLIAMGHSFGGCTAQYAGFKYGKKIKAIIGLDPWFFPLKD